MGDVTIAPGYHSGVAVVARQCTAHRQAAEAAARQAAADAAAEQATAEAEATAQQGASPDPQSPLHAPPSNRLELDGPSPQGSQPPASPPMGDQDD